MPDLSLFSSIFAAVQERWREHASTRDGLVCKRGFYKECHVLKLQKPWWTNDSMDQVQNTSGIFFSVWIDAEAASLNRAHYNIHALKLRELRGFKIASRDFAEAFRAGFAPMQKAWPNVSVAYGPLTLMQGCVQLSMESCEAEILTLMDRFAQAAPLIDDLLNERRR